MSCVWMTVNEAAVHMRLHHTTVRRYIVEGKLKANKPGGTAIRICLDDLNALGKEEESGNKRPRD